MIYEFLCYKLKLGKTTARVIDSLVIDSSIGYTKNEHLNKEILTGVEV